MEAPRIRITIDKLIERYAAGERNFAGVSVGCRSGQDVEGVDLSGIDLSGADLDDMIFEGINLSGANLSGVSLYTKSFRGVILRRTNFSKAHMILGIDFRETNLTQANFTKTLIDGGIFRDANLTQTIFLGASLYIDLDLIRENTRFKGTMFRKTIMPDGSMWSDN